MGLRFHLSCQRYKDTQIPRDEIKVKNKYIRYIINNNFILSDSKHTFIYKYMFVQGCILSCHYHIV